MSVHNLVYADSYIGEEVDDDRLKQEAQFGGANNLPIRINEFHLGSPKFGSGPKVSNTGARNVNYGNQPAPPRPGSGYGASSSNAPLPAPPRPGSGYGGAAGGFGGAGRGAPGGATGGFGGPHGTAPQGGYGRGTGSARPTSVYGGWGQR